MFPSTLSVFFFGKIRLSISLFFLPFSAFFKLIIPKIQEKIKDVVSPLSQYSTLLLEIGETFFYISLA